ncbi:AAA family ATPase [Paraburkholderia sp. A1RI_3L]|uniref:AAA family ATPase n=1 Tax=Paraburkholderia TaxID=1822464 RepID=UPI003B81358E
MFLVNCKLSGLAGFSTLELKDLNSLTALIGPNGTGKSSILNTLRLVFEILGKNTLSDLLPKHDPWNRFNSAYLEFSSQNPLNTSGLSEHVGEGHQTMRIEVICDDSTFCVNRIEFPDHSLDFSASQQLTRSAISDAERSVQEAMETIRSIETQMRQLPPQNQHTMTPQLDVARKSLPERQEQLRLKNLVKSTSSSTGEQTFQRSDVDSFLKELSLPSFEYIDVDASHLLESNIPKFIHQLMAQKKGRKSEFKKYDLTVKRLNHLLQADIDLSEEAGGGQSLHINGAPYGKASTGTKVSLSFFGLTRLIDQNCIVLWDEPENGLHPTRRSRILDLIFEDGRQYVIATHASEFAPVFTSGGRVFRCIADYNEENLDVRLGVNPIATRREAYSALEALGIHPAKTLFTANVVIWVEGPTELLFYRRWLTKRLSDKGLREGFHYTFMQYGGALISYMSAADDAHFLSAFDTLSVCRHPIIVVDSDLRHAPEKNSSPSDYLKAGARRIFNQINLLNKERPRAAMFAWTGGREVENYLPEKAVAHAVTVVWKSFEKYADQVSLDGLKIGQYEAYHEAISDFLTTADIVDSGTNGTSKALAKGRSAWGSDNKVEFMEAALSMPGLNENDLRWDCVELLDKIEQFVLEKCEHNPTI